MLACSGTPVARCNGERVAQLTLHHGKAMFRTHWQIAGCAIATLIAVLPAAAQRATLRGQVVEASSGQPIAAAVIEIMPRHEEAVTDAQGRFTVRTTVGDHVIVADALGYGSQLQAVTIGDATADVQVSLEKDPVLLQGVVATASRLESRRRAYPYAVRSLKAQQIAASGAPNMEMFVRERFGVLYTSCRPTVAARSALGTFVRRDPGGASGFQSCVFSRGGTTPARVYIDEVRMPDTGALALYHPADIAEVEVYHNGEQVRVYTRWFMEWAARNQFNPLPLSVASFF